MAGVDLPSDIGSQDLPSPILDDKAEADMDGIETEPSVKKRPAAHQGGMVMKKRPAGNSITYYNHGINHMALMEMPGQPKMPDTIKHKAIQKLHRLIPQQEMDHALEIFSQPRIVPYVRARGLRASCSLDKELGWDLTDEGAQAAAYALILKYNPEVIIESPPCTQFSRLMEINYGRMPAEEIIANMTSGLSCLNFSVWIALHQIQVKKCFLLEHPGNARS